MKSIFEYTVSSSIAMRLRCVLFVVVELQEYDQMYNRWKRVKTLTVTVADANPSGRQPRLTLADANPS